MDDVSPPAATGGPTRGTTARARAALLYGGTVAASIASPRVARLLRRRLPRPAADALAIGGTVLAGWSVIATMERRHPFRADWNEDRGDVATDAADLLVSDGWGRSAANWATAPVRAAITTRRRSPGPLYRLPVAVQVAVMVLAFDLGHYAIHRTMHERAGWALHAPHHSPQRLYWLNATRFHPVELAVDGAQEAVVLDLLGPSGDARIAYQVARGIYGQIQHCNVDIDSGVLNEVLSTPERHRWHHSPVPAEGNTNYGAVVAVWDRLFGSGSMPGRDFDSEVGLDDPEYPTGWVAQLVEPFRR